jgi:hypothetical protein
MRRFEGRGDSLKDLVIAAAVFERTPEYDPQVDSLVRVEMGRLRSRLQEYYGQAGAGEPVLIEIPKGGYRPTFTSRDATTETTTGSVPDPAIAAKQPRWRVWRWAAAGAAAAGVLAGVVWLLGSTAPLVPKSIAVLPFLNFERRPGQRISGRWNQRGSD